MTEQKNDPVSLTPLARVLSGEGTDLQITNELKMTFFSIHSINNSKLSKGESA